MASKGVKPQSSAAKSIIELVLTVLAAIGLAILIQAFVVKPYKIPSGSMIPTLAIGQRVLTNRLVSHPGLGDIVVFHPPRGADPDPPVCGVPTEGGGFQQACGVPTPQESSQTFIKRVVGLPGDHLSIVNGHVIRNGKPESDSYIVQCDGDAACNFPQTITVPRGDYYMMGDNRPDSEDSRFWGPVPRAWIIGKAFLTYWPPDRIGFL